MYNVKIIIEAKITKYVPGKGYVSVIEPVKIKIGDIESDSFYCTWINTYGEQVIKNTQAQIKDMATIRMPYHPDVYNAIQLIGAKIHKNGVKNDKYSYEVYGSVDNYREQNRILEFKVQRIENTTN